MRYDTMQSIWLSSGKFDIHIIPILPDPRPLIRAIDDLANAQ